jgi:8-oxo-dGTP diphosphatase
MALEPHTICPHCGRGAPRQRNPFPTVDVVVYDPARGVVLVERANPPHGWALPGGFVDLGESVPAAAVREAREETGLDVVLTGLVGVYSDPGRAPGPLLAPGRAARAPGLRPRAHPGRFRRLPGPVCREIVMNRR